MRVGECMCVLVCVCAFLRIIVTFLNTLNYVTLVLHSIYVINLQSTVNGDNILLCTSECFDNQTIDHTCIAYINVSRNYFVFLCKMSAAFRSLLQQQQVLAETSHQ